MNESIRITVNMTSNYDLFHMESWNRGISDQNVNGVMASMDNFGWSIAMPVVVCKKEHKYKIVDGQHRFRAAVKANSPILYMEVPEYSLSLKKKVDHEGNSSFHFQKIHITELVRALNYQSKKWTTGDFINHFSDDSEDMKYFKELMEESGLSISTLNQILDTAGMINQNVNAANVKNNAIELNKTDDAIERTKELMEAIKTFEDRLPKKITVGDTFRKALVEIFYLRKFQFEKLLESVDNFPELFKHRVTGRLANLKLIVDAHNKSVPAGKRTRIFMDDQYKGRVLEKLFN